MQSGKGITTKFFSNERAFCLCFWCDVRATYIGHLYTGYQPIDIVVPLYYLATGGRVVQCQLVVYLWCLHCGPNCSIFCFASPILLPLSLYLSLSLSSHSLFLSFSLFLLCFLDLSSFRCGLLHLRQ